MNQIESILAIDHGSTLTKVALLELVENSYRFVTQAEVLTCATELTHGLLLALEAVQQRAGRRLLEEGRIIAPEQTDGAGVDAIVVTTSAGNPLRLLLAGIVPDSPASAVRRIAATLPTDIVGTLGIDDLRRHGGPTGAADYLKGLNVDVGLFAGGSDSAFSDSLIAVARALAGMSADDVNGGDDRLPMIYGGSKVSFPNFDEVLGTRMNIRVVPNIEPGNDQENLQPACEELSRLYAERNTDLAGARRALMPDDYTTVVAAAKGMGVLTRFLARRDGLDTLVVDLGSKTTSIYAVQNGHFRATVKTGIGLGAGARAALEAVGMAKVKSWLGPEITEDLVLEQVMNKTLRPHTIPYLLEDIQIEQALARELLTLMIPGGQTFGTVVVSGGILSRLQRPGLTALSLLDALQPKLTIRLAIDDLSLLSRLGALATIHPNAAGQALDSDAICALGTVVTIVGNGKEGDVAVVAKIQYGEDAQMEIHVPFGSIEVVPLAAGERARLTLTPAPKAQIGLAPAGKKQEMEIAGGAVGLIIDARGRPLVLPTAPDKRGEKLEEWRRAVDIT